MSKNKVTPLGDIPHVEKVIDLNGFLPLSGFSKKFMDDKYKSVKNFFKYFDDDEYQYFKIPTRDGLSFVINGPDTSHSVRNKDDDFYWFAVLSPEKFSDVPIVPERELVQADVPWARLAYSLQGKGKEFFEKLAFGSGFEEAQAVAVILTKESAIVVLNLRYSSWVRNSTGQLLLALEFSRGLVEYRRFYYIYSNLELGIKDKLFLKTVSPIAIEAAKAYFQAK
jgi:hypothetical protein